MAGSVDSVRDLQRSRLVRRLGVPGAVVGDRWRGPVISERVGDVDAGRAEASDNVVVELLRVPERVRAARLDGVQAPVAPGAQGAEARVNLLDVMAEGENSALLDGFSCRLLQRCVYDLVCSAPRRRDSAALFR